MASLKFWFFFVFLDNQFISFVQLTEVAYLGRLFLDKIRANNCTLMSALVLKIYIGSLKISELNKDWHAVVLIQGLSSFLEAHLHLI